MGDTPSIERLRVCFAEFAIFCLVEVILNFVFARCIFIFSYFPLPNLILRQYQN